MPFAHYKYWFAVLVVPILIFFFLSLYWKEKKGSVSEVMAVFVNLRHVINEGGSSHPLIRSSSHQAPLTPLSLWTERDLIPGVLRLTFRYVSPRNQSCTFPFIQNSLSVRPSCFFCSVGLSFVRFKVKLSYFNRVLCQRIKRIQLRVFQCFVPLFGIVVTSVMDVQALDESPLRMCPSSPACNGFFRPFQCNTCWLLGGQWIEWYNQFSISRGGEGWGKAENYQKMLLLFLK